MLTREKIEDLEKQGYRFAGNHSAVKLCTWSKRAILDKAVCYKQDFYGIQSHRCLQMTPSFCCNHLCLFCWRDIEFTQSKWDIEPDSPKTVLDECIKAHRKYIAGIKGRKEFDREKFQEANEPNQVAISLSGEPTFYPRLPELIDEIKSRAMTAFLVTNGTAPEVLNSLVNHQPTQLYITLPAPDESTYLKTCNPVSKDSWKKIQESLGLLKHFKRSVIRLTLAKDINMLSPESYADIISKSKPNFIEVKAYMFVGYSRHRLEMKNMPLHEEIIAFSKEMLNRLPDYIFQAEKRESRVVLLMKKGAKQFI